MSEKKKAIALFSYTAAYEDELSFNQGDVLLVTGLTSIEEGWFQAEKDGKTGIVPGNYLEFISDQATNADPKTVDNGAVAPAAPKAFRVCGQDADGCILS